MPNSADPDYHGFAYGQVTSVRQQLINYLQRWRCALGGNVFNRVAALKAPEECEIFIKNVLKGDRPNLAREARQRSIILAAAARGAISDAEREALKAVFKSFDRNVSRDERNGANLQAPGWASTIRECELKADAVNLVGRICEELRKDG